MYPLFFCALNCPRNGGAVCQKKKKKTADTVVMRKKNFIFGVTVMLVVAFCLLCGCEKVENMGSLPQLSKPYVGEYQCEKLIFGGEEQVDKFDYIKLTLKYGGSFVLSYRDAEKREGAYEGEYAMSDDGKELTLSAKAGLRTVSRTFPVDRGTILMDLTFAGKLLHAEFKMP